MWNMDGSLLTTLLSHGSVMMFDVLNDERSLSHENDCGDCVASGLGTERMTGHCFRPEIGCRILISGGQHGPAAGAVGVAVSDEIMSFRRGKSRAIYSA